MKKLFLGVIATVLFSSICYSQEKVCIESVISKEDFKGLNEQEKKLANFIDAGIATLKGMELHGSAPKKYAAIINVSPKGDKLENSIIISEVEGQLPSAHSCVVCDVLGASICIRRIIRDLGNGSMTITLEREGDCIRVSWPDV